MTDCGIVAADSSRSLPRKSNFLFPPQESTIARPPLAIRYRFTHRLRRRVLQPKVHDIRRVDVDFEVITIKNCGIAMRV
jgi:hypothetical protein